MENSLAILREVGDHQSEGITLYNISQIYDAKGQYDKALQYLEKSLAIKQEIGDKLDIATIMHNMGTKYLDHKNDLETATVLLFNSYTLLKQLGSPDSRHPAAYLQKIIERIGEDSYREILAKHGLDDSGLDITGR